MTCFASSGRDLPPGRSREVAGRGFTLIEAILVLLVLGIGSALAMPAFISGLNKARVEGTIRETELLLHRARFQAIKRRTPTVVLIDPARGEFFAFVDLHGETAEDPPDGLFNPLPGGRPHGTTDLALGRIRLPAAIDFRFQDLTGLASVDGFVNTGNPDPPDAQLIFEPLGSVVSAGAFRIADQRDNYLEVRIRSRRTARIAVRKWDGGQWREFGEGGHPWTWR